MLVKNACPSCHTGSLVVEDGPLGRTAICQQCGYLGDPDTVRKLLTLQAQQSVRERERIDRD